jgi:HlyD family secretion protein
MNRIDVNTKTTGLSAGTNGQVDAGRGSGLRGAGKAGRRAVVSATFILLCAGLALFASCANKTGRVESVVVKTAEARSGHLEKTIDFSGVLAPNKTVSIYSKLSGQVTEVTSDVGNLVQAGQLLVQIDTKELNAQASVAQAAVRSVKDQTSQAQIAIENAKSNLDYAKKSFDRTKALFDTNAVPQSQLDDAQNKLTQSEMAFQNETKRFQILSGSGLAQSEAQLNLIQVQISNSTITSPISGIVTNKNINLGEIAPMGSALMAVADVSTLKLQGNVSQDALPLLSIGMKVSVSVDGLPDDGRIGEITQIGPMAAATGQYFPVVISLKNTRKLMAGMTATGHLDLTSPEGTIVPLSAIVPGNGNKAVFVVEEGRAVRRPVVLGLANDRDVLVLKGVASGDLVVAGDTGMVHEGMAVATVN